MGYFKRTCGTDPAGVSPLRGRRKSPAFFQQRGRFSAGGFHWMNDRPEITSRLLPPTQRVGKGGTPFFSDDSFDLIEWVRHKKSEIFLWEKNGVIFFAEGPPIVGSSGFIFFYEEDKNFSVGLFNLLNNPYRKIELPAFGGLRN
jgi:hypothetical protein